MIYSAFAYTGLALSLIVLAVSVYMDKKGKTVSVKAINAIGTFIDKYAFVFLILILAAFLVSRIFRIEIVPNGFHIDELSMAVDAKSILNSGTDRWGIHYPPYFQNYGGGQNALYTYIQAFILSFLPPTIFAFRIQAVFWGAVCFFAVYGICKEITGSRGYSLIGPVLVTTLPVYIMSERWGLESYLFLPVSAIVMYLLIRAIKYGQIVYIILAGAFMGVSLYTYAPSYIVWPIFLVLAGIYLLRIGKVNIKKLLMFLIPLGVVALPLILFQLVNFGFLQPFTLGISEYRPLPVEREQELTTTFILDNFRFYKRMFLGGEQLTYNSLKEFGTIYLFLLPFVIIGFVMCIRETIKSFKEKRFAIEPLILFFWFGATVFLHLVKAPNVNRINEIFMPFTLFIVIAVYNLFRSKGVALSVLTVWLGASFVFFMYFYLTVQDDVYGLHMLHTSATPARAIERCEKQYLKDENTHIYIQFADLDLEANEQAFYFAGGRDAVFEEDNPTYGNVTAELKGDLDVNANAVYIIGDQWPHITSYLISEGFEADQTLPGYSILYRK